MNRVGRCNSPLPFMGEGAGERAKPRAPSPAFGTLSRKRARGIVRAGLFSLIALTTYAVADEVQLSQQIAACSLQTDAAKRLACYDQLAANLNAVALSDKPSNSAGSEPINEDNALFKLSCAYFAKDC